MSDPLKCSDDFCDNDGVAYLSGPSLGGNGRCQILAGERGSRLWHLSSSGAQYLCREHAEVYIGQWLSESEALCVEVSR